MNGRFKSFATVAMCGAIALICAPRASATMELTLTNGASSVTITDGGSGDTCAIADCVGFNGALGNYFLNMTTGFSFGNAAINPFLDLNSINATMGASSGALTIATSSNGYTIPTPQFQLQVGGTSSLNGASTFSAYGGNSNTLFDQTHQIGSLTFPTSPFSGTAVSNGPSVGTYSLTLVAQLNGVTAGSASFDAAINAVPEPATMGLLGAVLLFTTTGLRRKFRKV